MNIQVFIDSNEQKLFSIDMEKVEAITEAEACLAINGKNGYIPERTDIRPIETCGSNDLVLPETAFAIDCMLQTNTDSYHAAVILTTDELWDLLGRQDDVDEGVKLTETQKTSHLGDSFTDEDALRIMIRYWRNIEDTPLTQSMGIRKIGRIEK